MRILGKTDLLVSEVGLGADCFGTVIEEKEAFRILDAYVEIGGNWIDTAAVYGRWKKGAENASERLLGKWKAQRKNSVIIATKGGHYDTTLPERIMRLGREEVLSDLSDSLLALRAEVLDFYFLHRDDPSRPVAEIVDMMEDFVKRGYIRYYGASNFSADRLREAEAYAKSKGMQGFSAVSNQYSALKVNEGQNTNSDPTLVITGEAELSYHKESQMPLLPYQSTARGYFSKRQKGEIPDALRRAYDNPQNDALYETLLAESKAKGISMQAATLLATATAPFPVFPLTGVKRAEDLRDVEQAMRYLG